MIMIIIILHESKFLLGKPAALEDENHPDWVPSQEMGHNSLKTQRNQADVERSGRLDKRRKLSVSMILLNVGCGGH